MRNAEGVTTQWNGQSENAGSISGNPFNRMAAFTNHIGARYWLMTVAIPDFPENYLGQFLSLYLLKGWKKIQKKQTVYKQQLSSHKVRSKC